MERAGMEMTEHTSRTHARNPLLALTCTLVVFSSWSSWRVAAMVSTSSSSVMAMSCVDVDVLWMGERYAQIHDPSDGPAPPMNALLS